MVDTSDANDTDLGDALSMLGDSMDGLSTDLTSLGDAVAQLQQSTDSLSEQQRTVSDEMGATAASLRERGTEPNATAGTRSFSAAADD
jgi:hypothetical protein